MRKRRRRRRRKLRGRFCSLLILLSYIHCSIHRIVVLMRLRIQSESSILLLPACSQHTAHCTHITLLQPPRSGQADRSPREPIVTDCNWLADHEWTAAVFTAHCTLQTDRDVPPIPLDHPRCIVIGCWTSTRQTAVCSCACGLSRIHCCSRRDELLAD